MKPSKASFIAGWIISLVPILFMGTGVFTYLTNPAAIRQGTDHVGFPAKLAPVVVGLQVGCAIVYAVPQTAMLGAILLTGFLGGAVACHVRIEESAWFFPVLVGVLVWLGLYLRDPRVRALIPLRRRAR